MKVYATKCDQCGKEQRDPDNWVHIHATTSVARNLAQAQFGELVRPDATVNVKGGRVDKQFVAADFCCWGCAGRWLFNIPHDGVGST